MTEDNPDKHIELNTFLRVLGIANTGGMAKVIIRSGEVKVNKEVETRNKRKLHARDNVEYSGKRYIVDEKLLR
jgi:ribosome-associated protein